VAAAAKPCARIGCAYAADGGHFEVLQWLRAQDPPLGVQLQVLSARAPSTGARRSCSRSHANNYIRPPLAAEASV
jgi:hypothetical protein